jgi:hypothetical protein
MQLRSDSRTRQHNQLPQRAYFRFYLHIHNASELVPFAFHRLFQQYIINAWALYNQNKLDWIRSHQSNLHADLYNGITDAISRGDINANSIGRHIILPSNYLGSARFIS